MNDLLELTRKLGLNKAHYIPKYNNEYIIWFGDYSTSLFTTTGYKKGIIVPKFIDNIISKYPHVYHKENYDFYLKWKYASKHLSEQQIKNILKKRWLVTANLIKSNWPQELIDSVY